MRVLLFCFYTQYDCFTGDVLLQEPKSNVTAKLSQCFDIHNEISELQKELDRIKNELATVGHLPPNLTDAERKLKDLKKKYREISNEFSKKVSK